MRNEYRCRAYTDEGRKQTWPTTFVTCPRPGDYVAAESGHTMKVARIIHSTYKHPDPELGAAGCRVPCVTVELSNDA